MSMITATTWVPRGFAAPFPTKYDFDEEEFKRITDLAKLQLDNATDGLAEARRHQKDSDDEESMDEDGSANGAAIESTDTLVEKAKIKDKPDDDLAEYDLDHYDSNNEDEEAGSAGLAMFGSVRSLAYHDSNAEDPYITMPAGEDEDEDREELQILATDNLLLAAKVEDEVAHLEVYVYEDEADNLYVHHDIMLPAIPLCVEWLDIPVGRSKTNQAPGKDARANFVAVGTFEPEIEVWDLDLIDCMYPNAILGQQIDEDGITPNGDAKKKKRRKKSRKANENYHVDAVLSLAANRQHRNLLASSSADKTIKLWDLNTTQCAKSYSYHTDKVCSTAWHPEQSTVLLSGSYDRTVVAADMRAPEAEAPRWGVESDVENVRWNPHDTNYFFASTENGIIHYHDLRNASTNPAASKAVWMLQAHDQSVSCFDINPIIPGFMATGSTDKEVKLWNMQAQGPSMIVSRNLDMGKIFSTVFAPDQAVGFRLAVAGSKGTAMVWDTSTNKGVRAAFADRVAPMRPDAVERLVGVGQSDGEDSDEDEEEADGDAADAMIS